MIDSLAFAKTSSQRRAALEKWADSLESHRAPVIDSANVDTLQVLKQVVRYLIAENFHLAKELTVLKTEVVSNRYRIGKVDTFG